MHKYRAIKTTVDGIKFDSKLEAGRYVMLKLLEKSGQISNLELQPEFVLQDKFRQKGKAVRAIKYCADFKYRESGKEIIEDAKGMETPVFKMKKKMFLYHYPDLTLRISKGRSFTDY